MRVLPEVVHRDHERGKGVHRAAVASVSKWVLCGGIGKGVVYVATLLLREAKLVQADSRPRVEAGKLSLQCGMSWMGNANLNKDGVDLFSPSCPRPFARLFLAGHVGLMRKMR